ncbi:ABC transporter substrate-binding protein [Paenibacillus psychroresistens]|nr:ABC transporter substrate-binding protein [Paenibacillus psychroresistens]
MYRVTKAWHQTFIVFILILPMLVACNKQTDLSVKADPKQAPTHLVMVFPSSALPKDLELVEAEINQYLLKKMNATLEIRPTHLGVWWDKISLMFTSNEPFDLLFTAGWLELGQEVAKEQIIPLDDLLEQYGQDITKVLDPAIVQGGKLDGKIYGVVTNKEFAATKGIVMRKDLIAKYQFNLSNIHELKDLAPILQTIKLNEPGIIPLQARSDRTPLTLLMQYGKYDMLGDGPGVLDRNSRDLKVINMYETPQYKEYAELMHKWNQAGYINRDAATTNDNEFYAVKAGKAFAYAESLKPGIEVQVSRDTGVPMTAVELTKPFTTTADTTSAMFSIPRTSKKPEEAMKFLNLLYTDEYLLNLLNWGIEGKHYIKSADNRIQYPAGVDASNVGYNINASWMFGNQLNSYIWSNEDPDIWEKYKQFNDQADKSPALGFVFYNDKVKNEIAACLDVDKEFGPALNTGELDPDIILPKYLEKLKLAGIDRIIAEKQRQLNEWAKK